VSRVNVSREKRRRDVAANMRALRQRKRQEAASVAISGAPEPVKVSGEPVTAPTALVAADDAVTAYLNAVVTWARVERTPEAGRFAGLAGDLIERAGMVRPGERSPAQIEKLHAMFGHHLKLVYGTAGDDLQRKIAEENLALAAETMTAGRADGKSIRQGLRSAATLIRRRPKLDDKDAPGLAYASMIGSFGPPSDEQYAKWEAQFPGIYDKDQKEPDWDKLWREAADDYVDVNDVTPDDV
jgi:hypothetical protein